MANKAKIKCAVCHLSFKSNKPTQLICDACERKRRQEKGSAATVPKAPVTVTTPTTPDGKPAWLTQATVRPTLPEAPEPLLAHTHEPRMPGHAPAARPHPTPHPPSPPQRKPEPRASAVKKPQPPRERPQPKPPKLPPQPFAPTPEQVTAIELRYLELAQPEYDGIRTQIAQELHIPKRVVREVVAALRAREHLPSWWEAQRYSGTPEDLARIKAAYTPLLPVPPLGVHKTLAPQLGLPPTLIYYGIRQIRQELKLPDYNPPGMHPELVSASTNA